MVEEMRARVGTRRLTQTLHREAGRCTALLLAVALLASLASAGSRYFYCPFMDTVVAEHCCAGQNPERVSTARQPDCCEAEVMSALPAARTVAPPWELPTAPLLAVIAPVLDRPVSALAPPGKSVAQSGLSPPPARRSAQRVVLRI
jgi:hypothetical protein